MLLLQMRRSGSYSVFDIGRGNGILGLKAKKVCWINVGVPGVDERCARFSKRVMYTAIQQPCRGVHFHHYLPFKSPKTHHPMAFFSRLTSYCISCC